MARMHKTTIEVDLDALGEAEKNLGTKGFKETVNGALADVNRRAALKRAAERVRLGDFHVPDEKTWAAWRAPRS
jgi:Arc/MetJ family transcription regulator